jgi:hypothetical protein
MDSVSKEGHLARQFGFKTAFDGADEIWCR